MSAFQVQQLKTLSLLNPLLAQTSRLNHQARDPRTRTPVISSFFYYRVGVLGRPDASECEKNSDFSTK